jgi:hypothetical protein
MGKCTNLLDQRLISTFVLPGHGGVHGVGPQPCAVQAIVGISRRTAYGITRVDVLHVHFHILLVKKLGNRLFRRKTPMSPSFLLPLASVPASSRGINVCPAPSATRTTACSLFLRRFLRCSRRPFFPSKTKGTSGMRTKLTSLLAKAVCAAINPDSLPMTFTNPTPLMASSASTCAAVTALTASETASLKGQKTFG